MTVDKGHRFLMEMETAISAANREVIHSRIPAMTTEKILPFAITVAKLRARYLEAAFQFSELDNGDAMNDERIQELRKHREMYEEARDAFGALTHAIERGYVDIAD